jgi:hypothetical protein
MSDDSSVLHHASELTAPKFGHAWRADYGCRAVVDLGPYSNIAVGTSAAIRAHITECQKALEAILALEAEAAAQAGGERA